MAKKDVYLNNPNLPSEDAKFDYSPEMAAEVIKCTKDILHFAENYFHIISLDEGEIKIKLHPCQKRTLYKMFKHNKVLLLASRQVGKTTLMTIFSLWLTCFQKTQRVLIVANKEGTAQEILGRIRMAYEQLPNWLKPAVKVWGKTEVEFANKSRIQISTTTGTAARGKSCNLLIVDEMAFIESHIVEEFWSSVYPIISSSKKSKVFIASTPNGTENLFYELYTKALKDEGGWVYDKILWNEIPGRDEEWKQEQIGSLGWDKFSQEFECEFKQIGESAIDPEFFERLKAKTQKPKHVFDDGKYLLWDVPNDEKIYVAGIDVSEGLNQDASVIQILDITNLQNIIQVAQYYTTIMSPTEFLPKLYEILEQWGKPLALIERNNCGAQVVDGLKLHYSYDNIVSYGASEAGRRKEQLGMISHTNTKAKCVANQRYWINTLNCVQINDFKTVLELKNFLRQANGTWSAKSGEHDDRVMSLAWGLMILLNEICEKYFEILTLDDNHKPQEIKLLDYGIKYYMNPQSVYWDQRTNNSENVCPAIVNGRADSNWDIDELEAGGWEMLY